MLVHVEREDRCPPRQRVRMVSSPLIDQTAEALGPRKNHPSGTAGKRLCHGHELGAPSDDTAEIALERAGKRGGRLAIGGGRAVALPPPRLQGGFRAGHGRPPEWPFAPLARCVQN